MANYYLDFVGLNTFIYEPVGWDGETLDIITSGHAIDNPQNYIGLHNSETEHHYGSISRYKNNSFSHNLPTTASFFPALMLKRNGPYGYNSFKQIRISQNPLTRKQIKNNVFTFITEPGAEVVINNNGKISTIRSKYGAIQKFTENPVSSRYKPFVVGGASIIDGGTIERFEAVSSYGNETIFFNNEEINKYHGLRVLRSEQYNTLKDFYLNGGLDADGSPIDSFEFLKYRECVYPPRIYQYKNYVRQRTTFSFPWRDDRGNRTEIVGNNGFNVPIDGHVAGLATISQSIWPLDVFSGYEFSTEVTLSNGRFNNSYISLEAQRFALFNANYKDAGILQNTYNFGHHQMAGALGFGKTGLDRFLGVAPIYNRKHTLSPSSSVVSPNGMNVEGINSGSSFSNLGINAIPSGEAKWEAGSQSGLNPFYDTYDNYIQDVRQHAKDYSIIPEFRISEHVETYQSKGTSEEISSLFSLTGALSDTADSSKTDFYKVYSTSEFMKHFEIIKKDHKDFAPANSISLKCKAIKKFLPYEGFYPAQRSVDLAKQFYNSYREFVSISGSEDPYGTSNEAHYLFQNLMVPTFAPGIFFNTIKSGVAVDYPLINTTCSTTNGYVSQSVAGDYYLVNPGTVSNGLWDRRIPFEAIVEPEKHLAGFDIFCNEPHEFANNSGSVFWDGNGNNLYKLMAHNFLAETSDFFMKRKEFTKISSRPSSDPNIGKAEAGKKYIMRIKMYKSQNQTVLPETSGSLLGTFSPPQYPESARETFTMYSRPTAFGPPQEVDGAANMCLSSEGNNYSFTPPYYYGQAWCDVLFVPTESKKFSIQEIISGSTIRQWRHTAITNAIDLTKTTFINGLYTTPTSNPDKELAMQLNSSINIFSQSDLVMEQAKSSRGGLVLPNSSDNPSRWVIQTKFETPMLNFGHLSSTSSVTLPQNASQSVPRGMWHQYGRIEEDSTKGIFLQVDDVPSNWIDNWLGDNSSNYESLVDLCGFSTEAKRLGEIADQKKVYEAVVAVPFIEEDGDRKFFRIPRIDIQRAMGDEGHLVGASIKNMITRLKRYVMPPPMDFLNNETIDPFAMYVFEFSHTFKKQDLANMWQNLYPEIGRTFETAESSITHELLAHELLGGGSVITPEGTLDVNAVGNEIPDRVRWMVFKVKQRAEINYFKKIVEREDELAEASVDVGGANLNISYNWPYDFFSLVELAKIESEVKFAERAIKAGQEPRSNIQPKTSNKITTSSEKSTGPKYSGPKGSVEGPAMILPGKARFKPNLNVRGVSKTSTAPILAQKNEFGRTPEEAEERARLKEEGKLGTGEYLGTSTSGGRMTKRQNNTDYDGDGKRDPEDNYYDPTDLNNDGSKLT